MAVRRRARRPWRSWPLGRLALNRRRHPGPNSTLGDGPRAAGDEEPLGPWRPWRLAGRGAIRSLTDASGPAACYFPGCRSGSGERWRWKLQRGRKVRAPQGRVLANGQSGDPKESATESRPPKAREGLARVKRCGKSAPRRQRCRRHGKPHLEQEQIGELAGQPAPGGPSGAPGYARSRPRATAALEECSPPSDGNRTRLTIRSGISQVAGMNRETPAARQPGRRPAPLVGRWARAKAQTVDCRLSTCLASEVQSGHPRDRVQSRSRCAPSTSSSSMTTQRW